MTTPAKPEDAKGIVLRKQELKEIALTGMTVEQLIPLSIDLSAYSFSGWYDGRILCLGGIELSSLVGTSGHLWIVVSKEVEHCPLTFARISKQFIETTMRHFKSIYCFVAADNYVSQRWIEWLGFKFNMSSGPIIRAELTQ